LQPAWPRRISELSLTAVLTAIIQADVSEQEKNEAKTLLRKLLGQQNSG
jgi:hypothetical protein